MNDDEKKMKKNHDLLGFILCSIGAIFMGFLACILGRALRDREVYLVIVLILVHIAEIILLLTSYLNIHLMSRRTGHRWLRVFFIIPSFLSIFLIVIESYLIA